MIKFLNNCSNQNNHLGLMYMAAETTKLGYIIELGTGDGSTPALHEYCKKNQRHLYSFESDKVWYDRFKPLDCNFHYVNLISNFNAVHEIYPDPAVILIDNAPGESRHEIAAQFANSAKIIVIHDSQPKPTGGNYMYEKIYHLFKYKCDVPVPFNTAGNNHGTWATALSNFYDMNHWEGFQFSDYEITPFKSRAYNPQDYER